MALVDVYQKVDALGAALIQWARPGGWPESPMKTWWLVDFRSAFFIAVGYLTFVFVGSVRQYMQPGLLVMVMTTRRMPNPPLSP
jgi:hypothetical protein